MQPNPSICWICQSRMPSAKSGNDRRRDSDNSFCRQYSEWLERAYSSSGASLVNTHVTAKVSLQARAAQRAGLPWAWTLQGLYRSRGEDTSDWPRTVELVNRSHSAITAVS